MAALTFHVRDFDGPLELLLALVQAHKMDLHDIPILELIDQYTAVVAEAQQAEPEIASSFLAMAAQLVFIKTRMLLSIHDEEALSEMEQLIASLLDRYNQLCALIPDSQRAVVSLQPTILSHASFTPQSPRPDPLTNPSAYRDAVHSMFPRFHTLR